MTHGPGAAFLHVLDPDVPERVSLPGTSALSVTRAHRFGTEKLVDFERSGDIEILLGSAGRDTVDTIVVLEAA
jgi:hypothetical protein